MSLKPRDAVRQLPIYTPAKSIDSAKREFGFERVIKLAGNENTLGFSPLAKEALKDITSYYPDGAAVNLREKIANKFKVDIDEVILGNGSFELLFLVGLAFLEKGDESIIAEPSFNWYKNVTLIQGANIISVPLDENYKVDLHKIEKAVTDKTKIIWLCNPNNPTGTTFSSDELNSFLSNIREDIVVVLDEAYYDFVVDEDYPQTISLIEKYNNIIVLRTFSKLEGLANFRIGYGFASKEFIGYLNRVRMPINVTGPAQLAAFAQMIPPVSYGAQGADVTLIGGVLSGGMVAVVRPENYDELKDLNNWKGHSIGVIQMSTSEMVTKYVLEKDYGYDINNDLEYTLIEDYPSISLGVQKGNVDIGFIGSQYIDSAKDQGLVVLTYLDDLLPDYVCCRQSAYSKKIEESRDAYVAYLKGQIKAYKDIKNNEDETVVGLAKETGESEDYVRDYVYNYEGSAHRSYNPDPNFNGTNAIYHTLLQWKYVESDLDLSNFFDITIYADALKEVIKENPDDNFYKDMWKYFKENNNEYKDFESKFTDEFLNS